MKRPPRVIFGMPAYNRPDALPQTLESLLSQTFTEFAIVIVDDKLYNVVDGGRRHEAEDAVERERMLSAERQNNGVVGCGALQFEIERAAEAFAQGEAPRAIQPGAKRRMNDELHAARLIEESLHGELLLRRESAERPVTGAEVFGELAGAGLGNARFVDQPAGDLGVELRSFLIRRRVRRRRGLNDMFDLRAQIGDRP